MRSRWPLVALSLCGGEESRSSLVHSLPCSLSVWASGFSLSGNWRRQKGIESLAVKPLDNFSGDPSKSYFADGMTDEMITKLSQISALKRVISRSTMMKYKDSAKIGSPR